VAKENNCGTIKSAQKAGWMTKSYAKPNPKPRRKSSPKPGTKYKQTEVITIDDNAGSDNDAGKLVLVPKLRLRVQFLLVFVCKK
jgi:hypothetical protein